MLAIAGRPHRSAGEILNVKGPFMKKLWIAGVAAVGLFVGSCLGPNRAFNSLHDWNEKVTEERWVNEGIFLVFNIIPVYGVAYLVDIVILNSIEWWGGESPMQEM